jgi:hypothetical protein
MRLIGRLLARNCGVQNPKAKWIDEAAWAAHPRRCIDTFSVAHNAPARYDRGHIVQHVGENCG